jgi:FecR protein
MKRYLVIFAAFLFSLGLSFGPPAQAQDQNPPNQNQSEREHPPRIGDINYVEGQATIDGQPIGANSVGVAVLGQGQTLDTQAGKVEVLLTPGVFLRVDDNTVVKMVSPDLARTEVEVVKGRAMIEVLDISKNNDIRVDQNGITTKITKKGLYDFDADHQEVHVFKGEAQVLDHGATVKVSNEHELALDTGSAKPKARDFDTRKYEDDFFRWNALRSGYLSEATADEAGNYIGTGPGWYGPGWYGAGWYWDPWFDGWTFIPGDGIFYSPFGWGFYSPIVIYNSPYFYGGGHWGHVPHHFGDFHAPYGHGFEPRGGFHGGGFHGGGFGGGGGFHGGGGGGHR